MNADHRGGSGDFDFFIGSWKVHHQRLGRRLVGDTEWREFPGTTVTRRFLGRTGNFDENVIALPGGTYQAVTLRLYDPREALWSIYWIDARKPVMERPMRGRFENGRGIFYDDDVFEGRPVKVRFLWDVLAPGHCRWQQALSPDDGQYWETNWIMTFTRA